MSEHYQPSGEPTRPLPPYRPAGPQAGAPGQPMFSPIPSQSVGAPTPEQHTAPAVAPASTYPPAPQHAPVTPPGGYAPAPAVSVAAAREQFPGQVPSAGSAAHPTFTPAAGATFSPGGTPVAPAPPGATFTPATATATTVFTPVPSQSTAHVPAAPVPGGPAGTFLPAPQQPAPAAPTTPAAPAQQQPRRERGGGRIGLAQESHDGDVAIDEVLARMVEMGASDVHLTTGAPPMVRISGALKPLEGFGTMSPEPLRRTLYSILTQKQRETYEANLELDFSHAVRGLARFRVNLYQQRESIGAAFRVIPYEIKPLEDLGVPAVVANFSGLPRGLVLVTGPTGSGKSTTLAAIVDLANRTREDHIMTVEDPIEFLHRHKKSLVNQREVGADTLSFANALKHVLRQDPDIILVGEMRDLETISVALTAAETGHLVFATLHTQDAAQTIDRVIDVFPSHQQDQVRTQLAGAIQGVVCQTLCKRADSPGRAVATEVLVATPAIRNLIREGKTHQIYSAMQAGAKQGMHTMDQHLAELVKQGKISYEVGLEKCHHAEDYNRLTGRFSGATQGATNLADPIMTGAPMTTGQVK
ncbi:MULTISPECIES: type IV pilus twitching motility protein PilT [Cellulomonas]|uniref:Twitching motility protein n=1 Tax=Cellulomonas gilvus (strain ATCC 13127 / NRRL B-14078) TaxID=593907 RepID=F8A6W5_CELGA|nr:MULTISPECIES: type IV pilus twitching motility protein PilT [Cellulomonas]AEI12319.1 twitching motility protein [Cellulomonas gilvus ATCC 13127]